MNERCPFMPPTLEETTGGMELAPRKCWKRECKFWHDGAQEDGSRKEDCLLLDTCHVLLDAQNVLRKYIRKTESIDGGFGNLLDS